jgi:putative ABC transport system permease protein
MWKLALRNVFRHKARTILTLAAISSGVISLVISGGFIEDFFIQLREATIHSQFGHVQLYRNGYYQMGTRSPYHYMINDPDELIARLRTVEHVADISPRVQFSGLLSNGRFTTPIVGEGVAPQSEIKLSTYITITAGKNLGPEMRYAAILGQDLAESLKLKAGDNATLLVTTREGALNSLDFEVVGIFQTFSKEYDERALRIPLVAAQELINSQAVHSLVFVLDETAYTNEVAHRLAAVLPRDQFEIKTWYELADFYQKAIDLYRRYFLVLRLIILGMVLLAVVNSVNITIYERSGEFGTLRALGNRSKQILHLILMENLIVGLIGSGIGIVAGILLALSISAIGISMPPMPNTNIGYIAAVRLMPSEIGISFLVGLLATCLATFLPAWRASHMVVVDALARN